MILCVRTRSSFEATKTENRYSFLRDLADVAGLYDEGAPGFDIIACEGGSWTENAFGYWLGASGGRFVCLYQEDTFCFLRRSFLR